MPKSAASLAQATRSLPGGLLVRSCFQITHATWALYMMLNNARTKHAISAVLGCNTAVWKNSLVRTQASFEKGVLVTHCTATKPNMIC